MTDPFKFRKVPAKRFLTLEDAQRLVFERHAEVVVKDNPISTARKAIDTMRKIQKEYDKDNQQLSSLNMEMKELKSKADWAELNNDTRGVKDCEALMYVRHFEFIAVVEETNMKQESLDALMFIATDCLRRAKEAAVAEKKKPSMKKAQKITIKV